MDIYGSIFLILFFLLVAPAAAALLAEDVAQQEVFAPIRAWIEAHYPGGLLAYLINCTHCLSHWTMAALTLLFLRQWALLPYDAGFPVAVICWAAGTKLATRWWLTND